MSTLRQALTPRTVIMLLLLVVIMPLLPMIVSGHWGWWEAWVYAAIALLGFVLSRVVAGRANPGLLAERGRSMDHADTEPFDKVLAPIVGIGAGLIPLAVGIEVVLGRAVAVGVAVELVALAALLAGYVLASWALVANPFFSGVVRLQTERGHHVIAAGPYATVRHPGYAGALLSYLATPFFLSALWALVVVAVVGVALVIRIRLEERTLRAKLPGYAEYAQRVRWRLLPGVW
jgi:protein-S-isoprenylcysteine O-methyltransferase Ste14